MGHERIRQIFEQTRDEKRAAFMPYFTLGYPDLSQTSSYIQAIADNGADLIELGVPFSDPLADGAMIQHSTQVALNEGMSVRRAMEITRGLRQGGIGQGLILMGYINPILSYGIERYAREAAESGVDGLIVPDLPMQEAQSLEEACRQNGLALIAMLAPNSTEERIRLAADHANGFIYLVSVTGVTGERDSLSEDLSAFVQRVRKVSHIPLAVGFGISNPKQAKAVAEIADGVIVGSAMIKAARKGLDALVDLTIQLRRAMMKNGEVGDMNWKGEVR